MNDYREITSATEQELSIFVSLAEKKVPEIKSIRMFGELIGTSPSMIQKQIISALVLLVMEARGATR